MSRLLAALGRAHAVSVLRAVASSSDGMAFNTVRRVVGLDSRTASARFRELVALKFVHVEDGLYRITPAGQRALDTIARLHLEAGEKW